MAKPKRRKQVRGTISQKYAIIIALVVVFGVGLLLRSILHPDSSGGIDLPPAVPYSGANAAGAGSAGGDVLVPFEGGVSSSENYALETAPGTTPEVDSENPLAQAVTLPARVNLDVPFTSQAPHADWNLPFQEACEEASAIMVDGYYQGMSGKIDPDDATDMIYDVVSFQQREFGYYEDTNAEETARFIRAYFGYDRVIVLPFSTVEELKRPIALGYPVILPSAGQLLGNPYFSGDGPPYHMIVLRGYTEDSFITNDPGTRRGESFVYSYDTILNAAHDWTGSKDTVASGSRVMLVVLPN